MSFRFPGRWPEQDPGLNPLSEALEQRRASGQPLFDLTVSNPTQCGLQFPEGWEQALLGEVRSYEPSPRGGAAAREAIAAYYNERDPGTEGRGMPMDPQDLFLTAGTSEAYSHLFKLLCEPGDHALIPRPSYPLLETLAELDGISLGTYNLVPDESERAEVGAGTPWALDRKGIEGAVTSRTRILFIVQPNNPTGSILSAEDAEWLLELAGQRRLALVVDEVFADYTHGHETTQRIHSSGPLVFTLNGLSKLLGLPQLKLAWIHVAGNTEDKEKAERYLEWICDAYLSVGTAAQSACAELLRRRKEFQGPIRERLKTNLATLGEFAGKQSNLQVMWPQGGWCVPVRCPGIVKAKMDDEVFAIRLLESEGVQVHPGYFFDFDNEDVLILSLLPNPEIFREGLTRIYKALT